MNGLEERLRSELHAESEQITPGSLATLRLPEPRQRGRSWRSRVRPGRSRRWPGWAVPLAAAATVAVLIIGTVALVRTAAVSPAGPAVASHAPAYYAYGVPAAHPHRAAPGTGGEPVVRSIAVRSVATGGLVAHVPVPRPLTSVVTLTAAANVSSFVFSAERLHWQRSQGGRWALDEHASVRFFLLRIASGGQPRLTTLPQTVPEPLVAYTSIALSPDGRRLAMASVRGRTAVLRVITLGSGAVREWTLPHASWRPALQPSGAWTADGRTLMMVMGNAPASPGPLPTGVRLLDTAAPGTSLAASRQLNLPLTSGNWAKGGIFITPDGAALLAPVTRVAAAGQTGQAGQAGDGFLARYSARTGALLRTLGKWTRHGHGEPLQAVLWSSPSGDRLLALQPRPAGVTLGVLTGNSFRTTGVPLPPSQAVYQDMQTALRAGYLAPYPVGVVG